MGTGLMTMGDRMNSLTTVAGADGEYQEFNQPRFLQRIQFYSKGKSFGDDGFIAPGHWGVPLQNGQIEDLGAKIDVLPIARRMKAMDLSDLESVVVTCDVNSDEYARIKAQAKAGTRDYLWGPSYLVVERATGLMYELFCGSKTLAEPAQELSGHCLLTAVDCERMGHSADKAHDAIPATLGSRKVESKKYNSTWFVATVNRCSLPLTNLPSVDSMLAEVERFVTLEPSVESVSAEDAPKREY